MVDGIESECWPDSGRNGGRFPVGIVAGFERNTHCPECGQRGKVYDRQPQRLFEYLPVWTFKAYFRYAPRRVSCPVHGVKVEALPWGYGKERMTFSYQVFLARWAKRLSWKETADTFETSWDTVFRAVKFVVDYGLAHRNLDGVTEIGVDEIKVFKGHKYLTLVYQLNAV
jgi:transposase